IAKNEHPTIEKFGGVCIVTITSGLVILLLFALNIGITLITIDYVSLIVSVIIGGLLLKTTIAIHGMEKHAKSVLESLDEENLDMARNHLSMIVKRNTANLDKNHVLSGVLESISENTVDGITGPLFYYALFGLPGAFVYRVINTADSMIGYKTDIFKNVGWFAATCDSILNYIPSRLTGLIMIISAAILHDNWKESYKIMIRDGKKTESPNAGYPMAALAGALETKFEKINHYKLGDGETILTKEHVHSAISIMKLTSVLFFGIIIIPIISILSFVGWWIHV
ncbi:MAG: cobalamin biosynthesis protein, partial [Nitrosopumilus sp.]|nr:cobalamin biosynthesis protein [Nitrosopumilus sp.]